MTDPTNTVTTVEQARVLARAMLRLAPDPAPEPWQSLSEPILTVLLYRSSPAVDGDGLAGVVTAVNVLAGDHGDAATGLGISDLAQSQCFSFLDRLKGLQRESVITTIRDAVSPWMAAWV